MNDMALNVAPCRFCGQMVQIAIEKKLTKPQAEEEATMRCECMEAVAYQKEKRRKEKALKNIEKLFGEGAEPEKRIRQGIKTILTETVAEICEGGLEKVTLDISGGIKASICQNAKGEIKIERKETRKQQLTE